MKKKRLGRVVASRFGGKTGVCVGQVRCVLVNQARIRPLSTLSYNHFLPGSSGTTDLPSKLDARREREGEGKAERRGSKER